ncbi:hypothetical protein SAMN02745673_02474 [Marinactinospora thermotolerans DSM 45154]|uniref:Uncharacterized protein n=1 Tax=Marinactinospora thermotolerans DSM 45154 TaxID=1122192 RepID=A0A1T4R3K2_9ACTN|nr:hypothetical protein [Marinactinospora thermotolerans]SKA10427.1 hypothetical protein SAMN02745673_02474 [Marinactinospora thermotolerans DSM 45154]
MTYDVVALVGRAPGIRELTGAMVRAGRRLRVDDGGGGSVIRLCDDRGRTVLGIEAAQRVEVRDEVERLLGAETAARMPEPCWWVEARAAGSGEEAVAVAHRFADALVGELGGIVWSSRPALRRPAGWSGRSV